MDDDELKLNKEILNKTLKITLNVLSTINIVAPQTFFFNQFH
jgi:hypothetical protein